MELIVKCMVYLIILSGGLERAKSKPVHMANVEIHEAEYQQQLKTNAAAKDAPRPQRQVVQPTWLTEGDRPSPAVDPNVHVTKESLKEAEIIRDQIQAAVNKGHFVVELPELPPFDGSESPAEAPSPFDAPAPVHFDAPEPPLPPSPQWSFQFPQFQPAADMPSFGQFMPQQQTMPPNKMMEEWTADWQRRWREFMENSRKMFRWN